jgi:protein TonB
VAGQASVRPVDSLDSALEHLSNTKRAQVLVIDARDVAEVRAAVDRAHSHAPHAVVLVFATSEAEKQVCVAVKGTSALAVLPVPIDRRKTAAVLEGALADAVAKKGTARPAAPERSLSVEAFQPQAQPAPQPTDSGSKSKFIFMGIAGLAVAAIAAGAFVFFRGHPGTHAPVASAPKAAAPGAPAAAPAQTDADLAPSPVVETSIIKGKVDDLLEKARSAMRERRYTEPTGDNALLFYRSAVAADAQNGEALDGLQRVAGVMASRFDESINAGHFDDAGVALASFKSAAPKDARGAGMELRLTTAQVNKALADGNVDRAAALVRQAQQSNAVPADQLNKWRSEIARRQEDAKLQRLANLISDRIRDGKLLDPSDDSAKLYMQQLHDAAPTNTTTQRAARDLNAAYLRKARDSALSKNTADSDRWLAEAKAGGMTANDIAAFQRDLTTARQKATAAEADRLAQLARDRIRDGKLTDPTQDSASYYVGQLQVTDSGNAAIAGLSHDLATKLLDRARVAARDPGKASQVDGDLTQAKRFGADARDVQAVQQIETASRAASAGGRASVDAATLAAQLKRTRYVAPEFPVKALDQKISGVVTVEFTVTTSGETRDVNVTDSNPRGVFDRAAVSAVKRWRYEPAQVNGSPVEVPVRMSIRFELPK